MNGLVFFGLAAAAVGRLWWTGLSARPVGHVVALLLIALLGFRSAQSGRLSRSWGILAFVVGWLWLPIIGLAGLGILVRYWRPRDVAPIVPIAPTPVVFPADERNTVSQTAAGSSPESFALLLEVAEEYDGRETEFGASVTSPHGEHIIPLLVQLPDCELAIYVDANPWTPATEERCLRWLGLLRTSNREDVEVAVRGRSDVPERLVYYSNLRGRVVFEVAAVPQVKWVETPGFGAENAALVRRLAIEYLDFEIREGIEGLEDLDKLIMEVLREDGKGRLLPWTVFSLGSLFGEILVELYRGTWKITGEKIGNVVVEISGQEGAVLEANVFGKVMKLFENGRDDSTAGMARAIGERWINGGPRTP